MSEPITLETRVSLTRVMRLLEKLTKKRPSRSSIKYYGHRSGAFRALVVAKKEGPRKGKGNGKNTCTYSVADVVLLRWLLELTDKGLAVRKFYKAIDWLRDHIPEALTDQNVIFFLSDNENPDLCMSYHKGETIQLTSKPGQILLALAGSSVKETIDAIDETDRARSA
jgi:hypothetical protein